MLPKRILTSLIYFLFVILSNILYQFAFIYFFSEDSNKTKIFLTTVIPNLYSFFNYVNIFIIALLYLPIVLLTVRFNKFIYVYFSTVLLFLITLLNPPTITLTTLWWVPIFAASATILIIKKPSQKLLTILSLVIITIGLPVLVYDLFLTTKELTKSNELVRKLSGNEVEILQTNFPKPKYIPAGFIPDGNPEVIESRVEHFDITQSYSCPGQENAAFNIRTRLEIINGELPRLERDFKRSLGNTSEYENKLEKIKINGLSALLYTVNYNNPTKTKNNNSTLYIVKDKIIYSFKITGSCLINFDENKQELIKSVQSVF